MLFSPGIALADGALTLGARTVTKGYQLRASDDTEVPRRRVAQQISLFAWAGPRWGDPVVTGNLDLALETDFGLDPALARRLLSDSDLYATPELRLAAVQFHDVGGVVDLTAGRFLYIGPDAVERVDGGEVTLRSPAGFFTGVRAGRPVTPASPLSQDPVFGGFYPDTAAELGSVAPKTVGAKVGFQGEDFSFSLAGRRLSSGANPSAGDDVLEDRAGLAIRASPVAPLDLSIDASWDLARGRLARGWADATVYLGEDVSVGAAVESWRPDFWLGSVWDVFGPRPYTSVRTHAGATAGVSAGQLRVHASADIRSYGEGEADGTPLFDADADAASYGGRAEAHWSWRRAPHVHFTNLRADLWLRAEGGYGGTILLGGAGASTDVLHRRVNTGLRGYLLQTEPDSGAFGRGSSAAVALDLAARLSKDGHLTITVEGISSPVFLYELRGYLIYELRYDIVPPNLTPSRFVEGRVGL
jgi:hypothetical protein